MLHDLDETIDKILNDPAAPIELLNAGVSFETPDKSYKPSGPDTAVNLFLYEVKENRKLRNPGTITEPSGTGFIRRLPPLRVDCSYLVTAWNTGTTPADVKVQHQLLGQAFFWLSRFPIIPANYLFGSMIGQPFPPPTMVAQWDAAKNQGEFWNALGTPPRPYFNLIVTIAMDLKQSNEEYMVTSSITSHQQTKIADTQEVWIQIGGQVSGTVQGKQSTIPDAWVALETVTGQPLKSTKTNELGRFTFEKLRPGQYRLTAGAAGLTLPQARPIDVPSSTGEYDLTLS